MYKKLMISFFAAGFLMLIVPGVVHSAEFGVFSDVTFGDSGVDGENQQFALGGLDFYGTAKIDDQTRVFIEYVFGNTSDGLVTDLERLWVTRTFSDEFTVGVGRFHTPLGSWNRTFHHGAILQDTISRPFFLEFEDGEGAILPVHIVGLLASGDVTLSSGHLSYEAYVANGPSIDTSIPVVDGREIEINAESDPNSDKSIGARVTFTPNMAGADLAVSLFVMSNTIADTGGMVAAAVGDDLISQTITGFDFGYQRGDFDVLVEYYHLKNKDEVGTLGTKTGEAHSAQMGYHFADSWKAVFRHETLSTKESSDRYFKELGAADATHNVAAIRYDLSDTNTFKLEVNQKNPVDSSVDVTTAYTFQWSFLIP